MLFFQNIDMSPVHYCEWNVRISQDKDVFSKSDPVCLLFEKQQERWIEIGRTEMILNDLNPRWTKKFNVKLLVRLIIKYMHKALVLYVLPSFLL